MTQTAVFQAHVEETVEAAHSNGPVGHKCHVMHGHSWRIEVIFYYYAHELNGYGWGPDFGQIKKIIRRLDHQNLNDLLTFPPSAENIATFILNEVIAKYPQVKELGVTVHEGHGNIVTATWV